MTKESLILFWLSEHKPDKWSVQYFSSTILYTALKGLITTYIKYDWNTLEKECWVSMGEAGKVVMKCVGTVEECLNYLRKVRPG